MRAKSEIVFGFQLKVPTERFSKEMEHLYIYILYMTSRLYTQRNIFSIGASERRLRIYSDSVV